jgi:hypothetical protein
MNIIQFILIEIICLAMIFGGVFSITYKTLEPAKEKGEEMMNLRISLAVSVFTLGACLFCIAIQNPFAYLII